MGGLRELRLPLETVTPAWIGGAGSAPELRPPSFRGCLRFWFRALVGGSLGEELRDIRLAESAVFGNTQRASRVAVRTAGSPRIGPANLSADDFPGACYMFWSVYQRNREALLPAEPFELRLTSRPFDVAPLEVRGRSLTNADAFDLAAASVWLLLRLGGVGARVRRAAGTLRNAAPITGWPEHLPPLNCSATSPETLAAELASGVKQIRDQMPWQAETLKVPSSYDILHPNVCEIFVAPQTFSEWWLAVDWIGRQFQEFRAMHRSDCSAIVQLLTSGRATIRSIQRAVFGLPIVFFFKWMFESLVARGVPPHEARRKSSATLVPKRGLGRTSPLMIRIVRLETPQPTYTVVMLMFRSRFLPDRDMSLKPQDASIRPVWVPAPTDHTVIDHWFDFLRTTGGELLPVRF